MASSYSAAPVSAVQVGSYFVGQYYKIIQQQPDMAFQFYVDTSTIVRVDGDSSQTASTLMDIHNLITSMNFTSIEIKTLNSLESWSGGILVMVSGSVKAKGFSGRRNFVQTFFLAPQDKGYFVLTDIFQYIEDAAVYGHQFPVSSENNFDVQRYASNSPLEPPVTHYALEEEAREYVSAVSIEDNPVDKYSLPEQQQEVEGEVVVEEAPTDTYASLVGVVEEAPANEYASMLSVVDASHDPPTAEIEDSWEEPEKKTYASILQVARGQSGPPSAPQPSFINRSSNASNSIHTQATAQLSNSGTSYAPESGAEPLDGGSSMVDEGEPRSVYVRNLPFSITTGEIEQEFKMFGRIKPDGIFIRQQKDVASPYVYAFVEFEDLASVHEAIKASPIPLAGAQVYIEERAGNLRQERERKNKTPKTKMGSHQQQQQSQFSDQGGNNMISAIQIPKNTSTKNLCHDPQDPDYQKPGWRKFLSFVGPGFLVSLAYLDPGNMETDLQAGANHGFELLWVILVGLIFALIIQSLAANLGVSTGHHLAELCKAEYPQFVKYCLWLLAEVAVIAADIPEVIGTAFALNILFKIPVWAGVLFTGFSTLLLLGLQKYGVRKLELLIAILVFIMAGCFFAEMSYVKPPASEVLKGMFIPKLNGHGATGDAIALMGALVMPHNLFLHSALVLSRKVPNSFHGINDACRYFLLESGFALFVAFLINVAMISVTGTVCYAENISSENAKQCNDLTLNSASFLLKNALGKSSSIVYAIALFASGQSSTITGTYAGQYIMQGFLELKMKKWLRNLMTRCIAITPSLIVSIIGGPQGAGRLIIIASMILSFELPFALIPLLKFSSSRTKMGPHINSIYIIVISWILGLAIIGINIYYLITAFIGWILNNNLHLVANVFIGLVVFPLMAIYIISVIYLAFRKDTVETYIDPAKQQSVAQNHMESGNAANAPGHLPYREDLADIPLPE